MIGVDFHGILLFIQHIISFIGVVIILSGVVVALSQYVRNLILVQSSDRGSAINAIRLLLGRVLILGLEFIVAADLIGTITAPDYYSVGLLAIIVLIRTVLSFSLSREIDALSKA